MAGRRIDPTYRFHKSTGKAIVTYYASDGQRRSPLLPGPFNSDESRKAYKRILAIVKAGGELQPQAEQRAPNLTIDELILKLMEMRVIPHYRNSNGRPTGEDENIRYAMKPLSRLFGELPAAEFQPLHLVEIQQAMIDGRWLNDDEKKAQARWSKPKRLSRNTVNSRIGRIKLMFKWAAGLQLIPAAVHHGIQCVPSLAIGRSPARETSKVQPVPVGVINDTLPHLPPVVRDIVELLLLTGMRVGKAVIMRAIDIDMTGQVWLYRPTQHKNKWRNMERIVPIGPKAQVIIRRYLKTKTDAYLFSPREQQAIIDAQKRARRKTRVQPSQVNRKKSNPARPKGELFSDDDINKAIRRACKRAGIPVWNTHRIRHTTSREITRKHGQESARVVLGHATVQMTAEYSGIDLDLAQQVAGKIG